jgi:nitrate reductase (cytochrome), electron transfer subunit
MNDEHEMPPQTTAARASRFPGYRLFFIGLCILLMGAAVYVVGTSWSAEQQLVQVQNLLPAQTQPVPAEPFHLDASSLYYLQQMRSYASATPKEDSPRTLEVYYNRRVYDGAPPLIPHAVNDDMSIGDKSCLQCHVAGGYSPEMQAYTPVVPHPELQSCTSCHVPVLEAESLFRANNWQAAAPPQLGLAAFDGAPPPVPHGLQMRENCAACHAGLAAPPEIATDHIERASCTQCHLPQQNEEHWSRVESSWSRGEQAATGGAN